MFSSLFSLYNSKVKNDRKVGGVRWECGRQRKWLLIIGRTSLLTDMVLKAAGKIFLKRSFRRSTNPKSKWTRHILYTEQEISPEMLLSLGLFHMYSRFPIIWGTSQRDNTTKKWPWKLWDTNKKSHLNLHQKTPAMVIRNHAQDPFTFLFLPGLCPSQPAMLTPVDFAMLMWNQQGTVGWIPLCFMLRQPDGWLYQSQ